MNSSLPVNLSSLRRQIHRLEFGTAHFEIESLEEIDKLVDALTEKDFQLNDEVFPYWAQLWPSAIGLAKYLFSERPFSEGRLLDLGCGLGLSTLAARALGARVIGADYCLDALAFCQQNLKRNGQRAPLLRMHWASPPLRPGSLDWVIGSDILYEQRAIKPVADILETHLSQHGRAFLSTPHRPAVPLFVADMESRGFRCQSQSLEILDRGTKVQIIVLRLERKQV